MNHKTLTLLVGVLAAGIVETRAQTAATSSPAATPAEPVLDVSVTPSYVSTYMYRGMRLSGQAVQGDIDAAYGGWDAGIWSSGPIDNENKVHGWSNPEIDPYLTYTYTINGSLNLQPGVTWYTYVEAPTADGFFKDRVEPDLALNYSVWGWKFTPEVFYDLVWKGPTGQLTAAYSIPLKDIGTSLDFSATVGGYSYHNFQNDAYPKIRESGNWWQAGVSLPYAITRQSTLTVGWQYVRGESYDHQDGFAAITNPAVARGVFSADFTWRF